MKDIFAVIAKGLFYIVKPDLFGTIGNSFFTLFQLITLDDWYFLYVDVVKSNPGIQLYVKISLSVVQSDINEENI